MQPETQIQPTVHTSTASKHSHLKFWIIIVTILVLAVATCYLIYDWQHKKVQQLSSTGASQTVTNLAKQSDKSNTSTASSYSANVAVGYPLSLPHKKVLITLYLPNSNSILQEGLSANTQEELASNYTESDNDVIANWIFNNDGTASSPSDSFSDNQNIIVTALNNWAQTSDSSGVSYPTQTVENSGPMTSSQKAAFIANLKSTTASCAADAGKGFATNDKVFNVCFTLQHPQGEGGNWIMDLSGYGNISGTDIYLRGFIDLPFVGYQAAQTQYIQALKNITTVVQDNS